MIVLMAALVFGAAATSASASPTLPDHTIICSAFANTPSKAGSSIDAEGAVQCDSAPDTIGIRTCLQRYYSGAWHNEICNPSSGYQTASFQASISNFALGLCVAGTWSYRTYVNGYAFHGTAAFPTDASVSVNFTC
jgi:hypothetical protein